MGDDGTNSKMDELIKRLLQKQLRKSGITQHEYDARIEAMKFLYSSFYCAGKHHWLIKQLPHLLEPDTMTQQDWEDYITLSWKWQGVIPDEEVPN